MNKQNQVPYDLDYALKCLRDAIDYAEADGDFLPARKWVKEVELSATQAVNNMTVAEKLPLRLDAKSEEWIDDEDDFEWNLIESRRIGETV